MGESMELKTWLMDKCPMDYRPHGLLSTWTIFRMDDYPQIPMDDCHLAISGDKKEFNLMRNISNGIPANCQYYCWSLSLSSCYKLSNSLLEMAVWLCIAEQSHRVDHLTLKYRDNQQE